MGIWKFYYFILLFTLQYFRSYMRLTKREFEKVLIAVEQRLTRKRRVCGSRHISAKEMLVVTLR